MRHSTETGAGLGLGKGLFRRYPRRVSAPGSHGTRRRVVLQFAAGLFATALVAACQQGGRRFETTLGREFNAPLPVTVTDETTLVTGIAEAAVAPVAIGNKPTVHADPVDANGLVLTVATREKLGLG